MRRVMMKVLSGPHTPTHAAAEHEHISGTINRIQIRFNTDQKSPEKGMKPTSCQRCYSRYPGLKGPPTPPPLSRSIFRCFCDLRHKLNKHLCHNKLLSYQ